MKISILGKLLIIGILFLSTLAANVTASLDKIAVYEGDRVTLTLKASGEDIEFPSITNIAGYRVEGTSSARQMSIINGKVTKSETLKYTFRPKKSITIPSFDIKVNSKIEKTKTVKLKVVKPQASKKGDDFIFTLKLSKNKAYVGEAVRATFEFAYKIGTNPLDVKLEKFAPKHFWLKELTNPKPKEKNGYISQTINYLIFPQMAGEQILSNQLIDVATRQRKTNFIVWKKVLSNRTKIEVLPLPEDLEVQGEYNINASIDKANINANEPVNLTLKIKGFGNIDDIEPFKLVLDDEVVYASKPEIKSLIQDGKYGGEFIQKISIIADQDFTIPSINFKYFDIKSKSIKEIKTKPYDIKVNSKTKTIPQIQTNEATKTIQLPPKVIIQKEDSILKYIYALIGFVLGLVVFYIFNRKKQVKKDDTTIQKKIKKAKDDKSLYDILLPHCQDKNLKNIIKDIEENIYNNGKNKIDKKAIIELFEEEIN